MIRPIISAATLVIITIFIFTPAHWAAAAEAPFFQAPAGTLQTRADAKKQPVVIPNGRFLTPWGKQVVLPPHPFGLVVSHDGRAAVTAQTTFKPNFINLVVGIDGDKPKNRPAQPLNVPIESALQGVAFSPDDKTLYVSAGNEGAVAVVDMPAMKLRGKISLNGEFDGASFEDAFVGDIALSSDGKRLYAIDQMNFRIAAIDTATAKVVANYGVGRNPFGIALSPDGNRLYVVNAGVFQYSLVDGFDPANPRETSLKFPAFGMPSDEARDGVTIGGIHVKGLGDPNVPESFSLWALDTANAGKPLYRVKTGPNVGDTVNGYVAVGGTSPSAVVATERLVFVANANTDTVAVFSAADGKMLNEIALSPTPELGALKGVIPFGMTVSGDGKRLYVAEAGINAVGVIDVEKFTVLGHIPVCWYPSAVRLTPDGKKLLVVNAKGFGSGPNAGPKFVSGIDGVYVGRLMKGTLSIIDTPTDEQLKEGTQQVLANNGFIASAPPVEPGIVPRVPGRPSDKIHYVVFITKENRTFDEVFGDMKYENGQELDALPELAKLGMDVTLSDGDRKAEHANVSPNHHALAYAFGISDNFYMDSDVSVDGHHWLTGTYPNDWVETNVSASYSSGRGGSLTSKAPGRLVITGGDSTLQPEAYLEAGSIWENLERNGIRFRNWGEGIEMAGAQELENLEPTGARYAINVPMPKALFDNTSREFPTFNMLVSDKYRADQFIAEFKQLYVDGKEDMPSFINIYLPNDHMTGARPEAGYPFRASYVADNDLALGRVVDFLSHTRYWNNMVIFVTEDDPQGGVDHVDAHRSLIMAIGPWVKRGYVSHTHTSIASIIKTINLILGMPYLNQYDAASTDLTDFFTTEPDNTPYTFLESDKQVFDPDKLKAVTSMNETSEPLDDPETIERQLMLEYQKGK